MAIQVIPQMGLGERLGTALGTGLGAGLQTLAEQKLVELQARQQAGKTASGLQALLGVSPEESQQLAGLSPELLQLYTKQKLQAPHHQSYFKMLNQLLAGPEAAERTTPEGLEGLTERQTGELAKLKLQQQKAATQEKQFQTKEQRIEQHRIDKETFPYYEKINKEYEGAVQSDKDLNKMEDLIKGGNLNSPAFTSVLESLSKGILGTGLNLEYLLSPESQRFKKISKSFVRNLKNIFGNRITKLDLETYLQTIPTLLQSDEGKLMIIEDLREINEYKKMEKQLMDEIIAANNGKRPSNLNSLVNSALDQQTNAIVNRIQEHIQGREYSTLPDPKDFIGQQLRNPDTGEIKESNGKEWITIKG